MKAKFILAPVFAAGVLAAHSPAGIASEPPRPVPQPQPESVAEPKAVITASEAVKPVLTRSDQAAITKSGMKPSDIDCYVLTEMKNPDDKNYSREVNFYFAQKLDDTDTKKAHVNDILTVMAKKRVEFENDEKTARQKTELCRHEYEMNVR